MEAVANYAFLGRADDELSVDRGDIVKVLGDEDENWYKVEMQGQRGVVPKNYFRMLENSWYKGDISRAAANAMLQAQGDRIGAFLVRNSETEAGEYSLSVKYEKDVQHYRVIRDTRRGLYFLWRTKFTSLNELIAYYRIKFISKEHQIYLRSMKADDSQPPPSFPPLVQGTVDFKKFKWNDLEFKTGDIIAIIDKYNDHLFYGFLHGKRGLVPTALVKPL